mmetsp:Transcript_10118/g.15475  ORF Transcript_10118/g.15475 Transcript_10118/m.15475 type:complete len:110 (-) Transcript_10118:76-405(-)
MAQNIIYSRQNCRGPCWQNGLKPFASKEAICSSVLLCFPIMDADALTNNSGNRITYKTDRPDQVVSALANVRTCKHSVVMLSKWRYNFTSCNLPSFVCFVHIGNHIWAP